MTTAEAIKEMMQAWDQIITAAREQYPHASEEQIYQIAKSAMNHALSA